MRIIAFIQDEHSIKDIMKAQGIPDFQAPPPIFPLYPGYFLLLPHATSATDSRLAVHGYQVKK